MRSVRQSFLSECFGICEKLDKSFLGFVGRYRPLVGLSDAVGLERASLHCRPALEKYLRFLNRSDRANAELTILGPSAHAEFFHGLTLRITREQERQCACEVA